MKDKHLLATVILMLVLLPCNILNMKAQTLVQPPFIHEGDSVALISPSYFLNDSTVQIAANIIRGWGFVPVLGPNIGRVFAGKYAGTVDERISDLKWAYESDNIKAIVCTRGGYGAIQMLDQIPVSEYTSHPKWLMGYSDATTFHSASVVAGVMSIHGTMGSQMASFGANDSTCILAKELLEGKIPSYQLPAHSYNQEGTAEGILIGGNMATYSPLVGSSYDFTSCDNLIIFVEEVGESAHNIDRMFNILKLHGVLPRVKGIILGEFTDCGHEFTYGSIEEMLSQYTKELNIPVMCGFPCGHGDINLPLIEGAPVTLTVTADSASLKFNVKGGEATSIQILDKENISKMSSSDWFRLDGSRLQSNPTDKGIYIYQGRKVVIR